MKVGNLVKVIKNDMSLIIKTPGPKDNKFFNQIGIITNILTGFNYPCWYEVLFPAGFYTVRIDSIKVIK